METVLFKGEKLIIERYTYKNNNRVCLQLIDEQGYFYMTATTNIPDAELNDDEVLIKNYSENEGILEALEQSNIVKKIGPVKTGFVSVMKCKLLNSES